MTEELEKLRDYLQAEKPQPDQLEGIISDIVLKDRADRDLLIKLCIRTGVLQSFMQESKQDILFINRCKQKLTDEYFFSEAAAEKAINYCKYLTKTSILSDKDRKYYKIEPPIRIENRLKHNLENNAPSSENINKFRKILKEGREQNELHKHDLDPIEPYYTLNKIYNELLKKNPTLYDEIRENFPMFKKSS